MIEGFDSGDVGLVHIEGVQSCIARQGKYVSRMGRFSELYRHDLVQCLHKIVRVFF